MKLHWTDEARAQLRAIKAYISTDSPVAAHRTVSRIAGRCGQLAQKPDVGRAVPESERSDLRQVLLRPYRIIYRISGGRVEIVTIWHYRRLLPRGLPP
jgi:plasmid stabilization system protein ParE